MHSSRTRFWGISAFLLLVLILLCPMLLDAQEVLSLPAGQAESNYYAGIQMAGGAPPLHWQPAANSKLPAGITLVGEEDGRLGVLQGTPQQPGEFSFDLEIADSSPSPVHFVIHCRLVIQASALKVAAVLTQSPALRVASVKTSATDSPAPAPRTADPASALGAPAVTNPPQNSPTASPAPAVAANTTIGSNLPAVSCQSASFPWIEQPVLAGKNRIVVHTVDEANAALVTVIEQVHGKDVTDNQVLIDQPSGKGKGEFSADLEGLRLGQSVKATQYCDGQPGSVSQPVSVADANFQPSASSEWGRIRPYFSSGVAFSKENDSFSKQDLYVGFNLDKNWHKAPTWGFNTSFDARLTSVPVAAAQTQAATTTGPIIGRRANQTGGGSTGSPVDSFISSRKAALIAVTLYMPFYPNSWKWWYGDGQNAFFFAPIMKAGFDTLTGGASSASTSIPGTVSTSTTIRNQDFYHFLGGGIRLGHYRLYNSWNVSHDLISYLDVMIGQWENFTQCPLGKKCIDSTTGLPNSNLVHPHLLGLQGRLKIPGAPLQIGFDSISPITGGGHGDLRFVFGVHFDAACAFKNFTGGKKAETVTGCGKDNEPVPPSSSAGTSTTPATTPAEPKKP